jgi:hypothetical protein
MGQAALSSRARKTLLEGPDDPGRPVRDDENRIAEPSRAHVLEEGPHRLGVLLRAGHQMEQHLAAILADAPGRHHRLPRLTGPQPLRDPVDEQVDDPVFGKIAGGERLVFRPQPLSDLAHRRPAQEPPPVLVRERLLDVPCGQPPGIEFDRQILEGTGAPREVAPDRRDERLGRVAHLRRRELHEPLGRLHPARPIAVPVAARLTLRPFIALAPDLVAHLRLQGLLHDQLGRQQDQVRPVRRRPQPAVDQSPKALACPLRCRYPLHRDAP